MAKKFINTICLVTLGIRGNDKVEIKTGLSEGDLVVIRGQERLSEDMEVKIYETPAGEKVAAANSEANKVVPEEKPTAS